MKAKREGMSLFAIDKQYSFSKLRYDKKAKDKVIPSLIKREEQFLHGHLKTIEQIGSHNVLFNKKEITQANNNKELVLRHSKQCKSELPLQRVIKKLNLSRNKELIESIPKLNFQQIYLSKSHSKIKPITSNRKHIHNHYPFKSNIFLTLHSDNNHYDHSKQGLEKNNRHHTLFSFTNASNRNDHNSSKHKHFNSTLSSLKLKFPMEKYKEVCNEFTSNAHQTNQLTERIKDYANDRKKESNEEADKKKILDLIKEMNYLSKSRNIGSVHVNTTGMNTMVTKANADLMNFGDNCLKMEDTEFYHRSKEILSDYEYVRHKADIECEIEEKKVNRLRKVRRNQLIISKALKSITKEHQKYLNTFDNFMEKRG